MCFRPSLKFKLVWLGLISIHVDNCHSIQHQIYHPMNITQTQQIFGGGKINCKSLAYKHNLVFHTPSQNYKDPLWLGKILGNNIEWTLFYATKSHQLLVVVFWPSWKMMDANVHFMKQDKCWNVFWLWDLVTSTLIQHTLLDQGPYIKTTWAIVQTFKLNTQPWRTIDHCLL